MSNAPAVESVPEFVPQSGLQAGSEFYDEPYLETCCRSTLHRLLLCASAGRPTGLKDQPCLERLERLGLSELREDRRFVITQDGLKRHRSEIGATD